MNHEGNKAVIVSIHDVSPHTRAATEHILKALEEDGVDAFSLLVVPDHHHRGNFADDAGFCEWLRGRVAGGDEVVAHGYFHERIAKSEERLAPRLITSVYTAGEGEFFDLTKPEAAELLSRGLQEFQRAGFRPRGFIAPAWLLGAEAEEAVRDAGFAYTTRLREILRFRDDRRWTSQSQVWSVRSGWRRWMSLGWNATLAVRLRNNPVVRIGVHPVDLQWPGIFAQIRRLCCAALVEREPMTYERWIDVREG